MPPPKNRVAWRDMAALQCLAISYQNKHAYSMIQQFQPKVFMQERDKYVFTKRPLQEHLCKLYSQ